MELLLFVFSYIFTFKPYILLTLHFLVFFHSNPISTISIVDISYIYCVYYSVQKPTIIIMLFPLLGYYFITLQRDETYMSVTYFADKNINFCRLILVKSADQKPSQVSTSYNSCNSSKNLKSELSPTNCKRK